MCGIAGFAGRDTLPWNREALVAMTDRLAHRGPDADGHWLEECAALGHRRLSIIDLSSAANQPMRSACGRYVMVFNGEVYNFRELAERWGLKGLRTHGDTEVILEGFSRHGPEAVKGFNGMFAIALWDREERALHLFRDRMGIKPLYVHRTPERVAFASELKGLLALSDLRRSLTVDPEAVNAFLHLTYIPHPYSIYREVRTLAPGHHAVWRAGTWTEEPWWDLEEAALSGERPASPAEAEERLADLLDDAVRYRLIADVPTGTFLSGGTDSSLVTALAAKQVSGTLRTFSIGFDHPRFNEAPHARAVARHLGTEHTEFTLSLEEARGRFEDILASYDEPFGDSSAIPTMLVSELAREHATVILSGDGGDETHLGYGSYTWAGRLGSPWARAAARPAAALMALGPDRYRRVAKLLRTPGPRHLPSHIFSQEQYAFARSELATLLRPEWRSGFALREHPAGGTGNPVERQALFDARHYLPDDLLVKVDRASMRVGLEVRVPLLDHRLVAFAFGLPEAWRKPDGVSKALLKRVLYRHVPREILERPKWGFGIPVGDWLRGPWKPLMDRYLDRELVRRAGFVDPAVVERLQRRFLAGEAHAYVRLWLLILLHQWFAERHLTP